jgi:hypothetical protein
MWRQQVQKPPPPPPQEGKGRGIFETFEDVAVLFIFLESGGGDDLSFSLIVAFMLLRKYV